MGRHIDVIKDPERTEAKKAEITTAALELFILSAIREHTMMIMKKYIRQILDNYLEKGIIKEIDLLIEVATNLRAFGIGGSILYQTSEEYDAQRAELKKRIECMPGVNGEM